MKGIVSLQEPDTPARRKVGRQFLFLLGRRVEMHQWKNRINWGWYRSIIDDYRTQRITREQFVREWQNCQETMKSLSKQEE